MDTKNPEFEKWKQDKITLIQDIVSVDGSITSGGLDEILSSAYMLGEINQAQNCINTLKKETEQLSGTQKTGNCIV